MFITNKLCVVKKGVTKKRNLFLKISSVIWERKKLLSVENSGSPTYKEKLSLLIIYETKINRVSSIHKKLRCLVLVSKVGLWLKKFNVVFKGPISELNYLLGDLMVLIVLVI